MTPDKIYVAKTTFPEYVDWEGSPINTKRVSNNDVCYIRKAALMEWLNKKLQESTDRLDFHANQVYAEVIDKLNSM